jgi:hypothetical protein
MIGRMIGTHPDRQRYKLRHRMVTSSFKTIIFMSACLLICRGCWIVFVWRCEGKMLWSLKIAGFDGLHFYFFLVSLLDKGLGTKSRGTNLKQIEPWIGPFFILKETFFFWKGTMSLSKDLGSNSRVQYQKCVIDNWED